MNGERRGTYLDLSDVLVGPGRVAHDEHVARAEGLTTLPPCVLGVRPPIGVLPRIYTFGPGSSNSP